jgi:hypothetical protein
VRIAPAAGLLACRNERCTWKAPAEVLDLVHMDPGPEFTLKRLVRGWFVVCDACGREALGPVSPVDVVRIAGHAFHRWDSQEKRY